MNTTQLIRLVLADCAHNDPQPLIGMIDWLLYDCHVPIVRIIEIAEHFGIPKAVALNTIADLYT